MAFLLIGIDCFSDSFLTSKGVQHYTVTIQTNQTSGSATISAVGPLAFLCPSGSSPNVNAEPAQALSYQILVNPTTVTAFRGMATATGMVTMAGCIVDASSSLVKSVQTGTMVITAGTQSVTATVTAVTSNNHAVFYLGASTTNQTIRACSQFARLTYSGTTVTAQTTSNTLSDLTVAYSLVEFQGSVMNQPVQQVFSTYPSSQLVVTNTILSMNPSSAMIVNSGLGSQISSANLTAVLNRSSNTNPTNIILATSSAGLTTTTNFQNTAVVEFKSGTFVKPTARVNVAVTSTNTANFALPNSYRVPRSFILSGGCSLAGGAFANLNYAIFTSSTNIAGFKSTVSSSASLNGTYFGEFKADNMLQNLFMEGW